MEYYNRNLQLMQDYFLINIFFEKLNIKEINCLIDFFSNEIQKIKIQKNELPQRLTDPESLICIYFDDLNYLYYGLLSLNNSSKGGWPDMINNEMQRERNKLLKNKLLEFLNS